MATRVRIAGVQAAVLAMLAAPACKDNGGSSDDTGTESTESGESTETGGGSPPPAPTLMSPADGAVDVPIETQLCWNPVEDPDGDVVRYRVWVDDIELTQGLLGDEGYEGPCVGPLLFDYERTFTWKVRAFEEADPAQESADSETWSFSTIYDGISKTVFEDDFSEDLGWELSGDATSGAWIRGTPQPAADGNEVSQIGRCMGGDDCYFTGQNPDGMPADADVAGGSTVLTSPAFDLSGAGAATVQLGRFFYKSEVGGGPALRVELLTPDDNEPGGYLAHQLELLEQATADAAANVWTPTEYAACGVPMLDGSRLRLTATDEGAGILEAAVDSVSVHAHDDATVCGAGEGGFCDPSAGDAACPDPLLCCGRNAINDGVYRCGSAVAGLDFDNPPESVDDPGNGAVSCDAPDLITDPKPIEAQFSDIQVFDDTCELLEGCVGGTGWRTILRFTVAVANIGSRDLALGIPANNLDVFHYSGCHSHYHFDNFAIYQLLDGNDVIASGHKQAFCLEDTISFAWPFELPQFDCANQGISRGFTDFYDDDLPCQWIDITEVTPGDYTLRIELNPTRSGDAYPLLNERDYGNNVLEVPVTIP